MEMSPSVPGLDLLHLVADEVMLTFSERHHTITTAIESDAAFQADGRPLSTLVRALVLDGVRVGASRAGMDRKPISGGGAELLTYTGGRLHHFRVRTASRDEDGNIQIIVNGDPTADLASGYTDEQGSFIIDEHWVFAYTYGDDGFVHELFAAKIHGVTDAKVPKLILGPPVALGTKGATPPPGSFRPSDEDHLEGFDDAENDDESGSASA